MARLLQEPHPTIDAKVMIPQYRNALGEWDVLIDGATGEPVSLVVTAHFLQGQGDPAFVAGNLRMYMQKLADKVGILEGRAW